MKLTTVGKLLILILVIGAALGGWRVWQASRAGTSKGGSNTTQKSGPSVAANDTASDTATATSNSPSVASGDNEILLVTSASKKGWLQDEIARFNGSGSGFRVTTKYLETREALHAILDGAAKPALWCPSSVIWTARLDEAWNEKHNASLVTTTDPGAYRVFFRTPLVFLTTRSKAAFLRPLLSGPRAWDNMRALSLKQRRTPWGTWKWSHADPLTANSGMMTLGLVLNDFATQTGTDAGDIAGGEKFRVRMQEIERGLVYDLPAQGGSSALLKAFVSDPSRYDVITAYENSALEAAGKNPKLAVIYPSPTAISENVAAVLNADWVSAKQREGARKFVEFLGGGESIRNGIRYGLRPAQTGGASLTAELSKKRAQGFATGFSSIELPPYTALNEAAFAWRVHVAHKPPQ